VPLRLCVSKKSHRTISPSMRGRLETRRHRVHKANSLPSSPIPPSGTIVWRRVATTMRSNRDEWFPSVLLRLRASAPLCFKRESQNISLSMRGRLETRRHRDHRANSLPSSPIPPSGEEWLRRFVVTVMNGSPPYFCASVPLRLIAYPQPPGVQRLL